jgi:SRSO17 transposase
LVHAPGGRVDHARQLVGVGGFQLRQRTVIEQGLGQRIIRRAFQHSSSVEGARSGFLQYRQLQAFEEDFADLLGEFRLNGWPASR